MRGGEASEMMRIEASEAGEMHFDSWVGFNVLPPNRTARGLFKG